MMKKGFTLAEVLITLTIIGVVAVLTLPGLMSNTAEQQSRAALKKMSNTLSQAAEMNGSIAGFNYSGITDSSPASAAAATSSAKNSLLALFEARLNVETSLGTSVPIDLTSDGSSLVDRAVYLRDGTAVYFKSEIPDDEMMKTASDGLMTGIPVLFDTNGKKGPNKISSCSGGTEAEDWEDDDSGSCATKANRFIKDIYMMRLRDASVYPLGAASSWMMDDSVTGAAALNKYSGS